MPKFTVYGTWDATWVVEAEDADAAEDLVDAGDAGNAEITGYGVDNVVTHGKEYDAPDEREKCLACDHLVRGHFGRATTVRPNPHPRACTEYKCDCLSPVSVRQEVRSDA